MKIDNNTIAITGIIIVALVSITTAINAPANEIATGLVALGSTAIGGIIGYLAKSTIQKKDPVSQAIATALKKGYDIRIDENPVINATSNDLKNEENEE